MPFCTNCGAQVGGVDAFCHNCGLPQGSQQGSQTAGTSRPPGTGPGPAPGNATPTTDFLHGMSERTASVLCYIPVFGIIPAIIFLASQKFRRNPRVRFDAFQSLYLFVA